MARYLHSISIASITGQKHLYYFKKRANALETGNLNVLNHFYKGYIGKSIKSGQFINTRIIDTPSRVAYILSTFCERQWLSPQSFSNYTSLNEGRDIFNPVVKNMPSLKLVRDPDKISYYNFNIGTPITSPTGITNYIYQAYEYKDITFSSLSNYANTVTGNIYQGDPRTRGISFNFIGYPISKENGDSQLSTANYLIEIYENASFLTQQNAYLTSRYPRSAISPKVITNGAAVSGAIGRFLTCTFVADMPDPTDDDYKEGAGSTELLCGFINKANGFSLLRIGINDDQYFYTEAWADNEAEWKNNYYGSPPSENGKMLGLLPNTLGEPITIMLESSILIYISGVRGHYFKSEDKTTIKAQTAVAKLTFNYNQANQAIAYTGNSIIEHDASGSPSNYEELGGTDKDYWNIYHTLWGSRVGNSSVVLVNVTKHKRFAESSSNFLGNSIENKDTDIERYFHIYINDQVVEFACDDVGFYPEVKNTELYLFNENIFNEEKPDTTTPLISKKYGTVISDQDILFCMVNYPQKDKLLLVKFNINSKSFQVIREDSKSSGQHVACCYQRQTTDNNGVELIPACIIYRVGKQDTSGKVYLSKDTAKTWQEIADSPYSMGGGMYYLGGQYHSVDYGDAFDNKNT